MRICVVYDCLFPYTVGGAERWYRNLAERLALAGHEVTYLTMRQWERGEHPELPGLRVIAVAPRMDLYVHGRRRIAPPLRFGAGVLAHLLIHGNDYDVVHTASFPYFSLLAAGAVRPLRRFRLVVDWHEVWSASYWRDYLGPRGGAIGALIQRVCARIPQHAFCFSRLHAERLRGEGLRGEVTILRGQFVGGQGAEAPRPDDGEVLFAGRLIPEKRAPAVVGAVLAAARHLPGLRGVIFGDGPEREEVAREIARLHAAGRVRAPGFVGTEELQEALARALCLLLPSAREGYGLIVVEAAANGVPSVLVAGEDNAATEFIAEGVNGFIAASAGAEDLAAAILQIHAAGPALREQTLGWFRDHADELSLERSLSTVLARYEASARA